MVAFSFFRGGSVSIAPANAVVIDGVFIVPSEQSPNQEREP